METEIQIPSLKINQTLIIGLAVAASILVIVLYYENKKMREQMFAPRRPCNCEEQAVSQSNEPVAQSPQPSVMPEGPMPPSVVVD